MYTESVASAAERCRDVGIRYAIEFHAFTYVANIAGFLRLADNVGDGDLYALLDPVHLLAAAEIPQIVARMLGHRLTHVHLSDGDGTTNAHFSPGHGKVDWNALAQALREIGYDGSVSLENQDAPGCERSLREARGELGPNAIADPAYDEECRNALEFAYSLFDVATGPSE